MRKIVLTVGFSVLAAVMAYAYTRKVLTFPDILPGQVMVVDTCAGNGDLIYVARSFEGQIAMAVVPSRCIPLGIVKPQPPAR